MADQLYLSLWFPNFRLESLPAALICVMRQFAVIAKDGHPASSMGRVTAASAYPIDWTESPIYQRIFVLDERAEDSMDSEDSIIENAVAEATEQLYEDTAFEFEMRWMLWLPEPGWNTTDPSMAEAQLDSAWRLEPCRVRFTGFGPEFDEGSYEQNGHIRVDFGLDMPWTFENQTAEDRPPGGSNLGRSQRGDKPLERIAAQRIQQNVEKLLAFTLSVEKHCGISTRLLWTESGEPLAEKLVARLQRLN